MLYKMILLVFFCYAQGLSESLLEKHFSDIVLIINFNHPYYSNVNFLKELYGPVFKNIIFYGEKEGEEVTKVHTRTGYLLAEVIQDACKKFPHARGYLFLQDDCVLHFWNLLKLDQNKIWYAVKFNDGLTPHHKFYSVLNLNGHCKGFSWDRWNYDCGFRAAWGAYCKLSAHYLKNISRNVGENYIPANMCEVFYVPARFRESFLELNTLFKGVFCEMAVPTILCCLDLIDNWEQLDMLGGAGVGVGTPGSPMLMNYPTHVSWVHPVKFSYPENRQRIFDLFMNMLQNLDF